MPIAKSVAAVPSPQDPSAFDLSARRARTSREFVLGRLRAFAAARGSPKPFSQAEFNGWAHRGCHSCTAAKLLGSWPAALAAAGIPGAKRRNIGNEELIRTLEDVWRRLGHYPSETELRRYGKTSPIC